MGIRDDEVSLAPLPVADTAPSASSKTTGTAALSASAEVGVIDGATGRVKTGRDGDVIQVRGRRGVQAHLR